MSKNSSKNPSKKDKQEPQVNPDLQGFDVTINEFGEIRSTFNVGKLNEFLDEHTNDKKFRGVEVLRRVDDENPEDAESEEANWG